MKGAFLDREAKLTQLRDAWQRAVAGSPQLIVVWGRRRVGKSYLLSHFTDGQVSSSSNG